MWGGKEGVHITTCVKQQSNIRCRAERCNIICAAQSLRLAAAGCWIPSSQLSGRNQGGRGVGGSPYYAVHTVAHQLVHR